MHPRKFVRDSMNFAFAQYVVRATLMLRGIIAARLIGPDAFGAWSALQMMMEYGTLPLADVMQALRADQWLENHPEAPAAQRAALKRATRDAFYTDTPAWKRQVVAQAHEAALQALAGLAG